MTCWFVQKMMWIHIQLAHTETAVWQGFFRVEYQTYRGLGLQRQLGHEDSVA